MRGKIIQKASTYLSGENYIYVLNESFLEIEASLRKALLEMFSELRESEKTNIHIKGILVIEKIKNINQENIEYFKENGIENIELKIYSSNSYILKHSGFNFKFKDIKEKVEILDKYEINKFLMMQTGMLSSSRIDTFNTAKDIIKLKPKGVFIQPSLVYTEELLEAPYFKNEYIPQEIEELVQEISSLYKLFYANNIKIIETIYPYPKEYMGKDLKPTQLPRFLAGPYTEDLEVLIYSSIYYDKIFETIKEYNVKVKKIKISINPKIRKYITGKDNSNIVKLNNIYNIDVEIEQDLKRKEDDIEIEILEKYKNEI